MVLLHLMRKLGKWDFDNMLNYNKINYYCFCKLILQKTGKTSDNYIYQGEFIGFIIHNQMIFSLKQFYANCLYYHLI